MGFFNVEAGPPPALGQGGVSLELLHRRQCEVCPLNRIHGLQHPKMPASGARKPIIYMLGEAPGAEEDKAGEPFVGKAGETLRLRIPRGWDEHIRMNNCVRTRPPGNRTPTEVEMECCRPSIIKDIEQSKPAAIFGFGNVPLEWALKQTGITLWHGRRVPVKIGNHTCWFLPFMHPSYVMRSRREGRVPRNSKEYGSDIEFAFAFALGKAFDEVEDLPKPRVHTAEEALADIEIFKGGKGDLERVRKILKHLSSLDYVGFDLETQGVRPYGRKARILTAGFADDKEAWSLAIDHPEAKWSKSDREKLDFILEDWLYESKCSKVVHNAAFELEWLCHEYGNKVARAGDWECTMSQAYVLDERQGALSLGFLCIEHFGLDVKGLSDVDRDNLAEAPLENVLRYNALDARYHLRLFHAQEPRLRKERLAKVYDRHMRRVFALVLTQLKGVPVNQEQAKAFHSEYSKRIAEVESKLTKTQACKRFLRNQGYPFRPSSNKDITLMAKQERWVIERNNEEALLNVDHPVAKLILEYREWSKLDSTYVKPCLKGAPTLHPDGRLHPVLSSTKTRTSRTSSQEPNAQNYPTREHKEVRKVVKGRGEVKVVSFDYGQIQARNVAMESLDKALVKSYWNRYDIHWDFVEKIVELHPKWIKEGVKALDQPDKKKYYRGRAKNEFVFPAFFGAQPPSLSGYLKVPEKVTRILHDMFVDMFPDIPAWHKRLRKFYYRTGYTTGLSGYRRRAPIGPNEIINAPIQADEALIVCDAMARLSELEDPRFQANLEIHDDLTFLWPKKDIEKNAEIVIDYMLDVPFKWAHVVPISVEMAVGDDWGSTKGVGDFQSDIWKGEVPRQKILDALEASAKANAVLATVEDDYEDDPLGGSWQDGTGWASSHRYEKPPLRKKHFDER